MLAYETLLVEIRDGIGIITLNRPKVLNALNIQVFNELAQAAQEMTDNDSVRAVIITGGDQVFASGADINQLAKATVIDSARTPLANKPSYRAFSLIEKIPKPVIAAVAGFAFGGGCELTLTADIRVAADTAKFGLPEVKIGIIPGVGGTQRLPRLIGTGWAKEMIYSGDPIDAEEALRIGLVNKVVPVEQLMEEAVKMAKRFASRGAIALSMAKTCINEGSGMDLDAGLQLEYKCLSILYATEDKKEGMQAFLEKRKAVFQGR